MSIRAKLRLPIKRERPITRRSFPFHTEARPQSLKSLYSYEDFLIDLIRHCTIKQQVYHPHIPRLIAEFVPIYTWVNPEKNLMKITLSHCNTIVCNGHQKFGAVVGSKLDPRLDHIINIQLVDGVEFGIGICDSTQVKKNSRRDFMCIEGGYGYYNYKTKSARMKPKYPPGLYYRVKTCRKQRSEADICSVGDVLTMVVQREKVISPGGGPIFGMGRDLTVDPMDYLIKTEKNSLSFYKNGEDMGLNLQNLKGSFYLCLNYYFVKSKIRLLSSYNFRRKHKHWLRNRSRYSSQQDAKTEAESSQVRNLSTSRMS